MYYIYLIINLQNNKIYLGSTINFNKRKCWHLSFLRRNKHFNYKLQHDFNLYGEEWFVFRKYKELKNQNTKELLELEEELITSLSPDYNIAKYVEKPYYGRIHTKEEREKISKALKGRIRSKQHCENISKAKKGCKGPFISYESREKLKLMRISKPVDQYSLNGDFIKTYVSTKEAKRQTKINHGAISSCCNPKKTSHKTAGGYIWKWNNTTSKNL
jgi:group I intron endonuclease